MRKQAQTLLLVLLVGFAAGVCIGITLVAKHLVTFAEWPGEGGGVSAGDCSTYIGLAGLGLAAIGLYYTVKHK